MAEQYSTVIREGLHLQQLKPIELRQTGLLQMATQGRWVLADTVLRQSVASIGPVLLAQVRGALMGLVVPFGLVDQ